MRQASLAVFLCIFLTSNLGAQEQPIYLTGGHLVDVVRGEIYEDIGIVCEGGKITGLFFDFSYNENFIPPDAVRVDVSGKYLLPGLIDLHARTSTEFRGIEVDMERFFRLFLKGGVTTIRAMSNDMAALIRDKAAVDAGRMDGPNIIVGSNSFEQAPGFPKLPRTDIVHNPTEARELVSNYAYEGADWFPYYQPEIYQSFRADPKRVPDAYDFSNVRDQWPKSIRVQARLMAKFLHMGGMVGTGSDLNVAPPIVPGLSIHQEMQYFVDGGMTPLEVLRTVTIMAAEILGWETRFGSIEVGKQADIVTIDGNPLVDITNISNIDTVVKAGKVYRISELEDMLRNDRQ